MLRLITAAVLATACLAYPERREDAPADADANHHTFNPGMQAMQGMQGGMQGLQGGMQAIPLAMPGQFMPVSPNFGAGFKRDADEDSEKWRSQSELSDDYNSPFDSSDSSSKHFNLDKFKEDYADNLPFANMKGADTADLDNFEPSANHDQQEGHFRFFDNEP